MTIKQKQLILCWFDLLAPEEVDGIWGKKSETATRKLQQGLGIKEDGVFGQNTAGEAINQMLSGEPLDVGISKMETVAEDSSVVATFWDEIEFFSREEFRCKCGGRYCNGYPHEPQEAMVRLADGARRHFGKPATVISGLRCPQHNANEGGVENSQHIYGEACDIQIPGISANTLLAWFQSQPGVRYAYAINATNVHFDIPKGER